MRFLHTADWHLGVEMDNRSRTEEAHALLKRILVLAKENEVDTLLVSGDVFNTHAPSNEATKLYYDFLRELRRTDAVRNVVITAGNHDSPSYLEAPSGVLELLDVHVIGSVQQDDLSREVIPLRNAEGAVEAVVCAVPHIFSPGMAAKSQAEQDAAYENFVAAHYKSVVDLAKAQYPGVPIVAMGHFFATGARVSEDNAIRGNLHSVRVDKLPMEDIAYLALGHLHCPQAVNNLSKVRYSGSLMKMNFGECDKDKCVVFWDSAAPENARELPLSREDVPEIRQMAYLEGTFEELKQKLKELSQEKRDGELWVAALNTGVPMVELLTHLRHAVEDDNTVDIVYARNQVKSASSVVGRRPACTDLKEKTPEELFADILRENAHPLAEGGEAQISQEDQEWFTRQVSEIVAACRLEKDATETGSSENGSGDASGSEEQ